MKQLEKNEVTFENGVIMDGSKARICVGKSRTDDIRTVTGKDRPIRGQVVYFGQILYGCGKIRSIVGLPKAAAAFSSVIFPFVTLFLNQPSAKSFAAATVFSLLE